MKKTNLDITGMHCASCSTLINRSLNKLDGVEEANVNLTTNKATINFDDSKIDEQKLIETVQSRGYGAKVSVKIDYAQKEAKQILKIKRKFLISLVFSFPVFVLGMFFMDSPIQNQNIIMWLLATPVQFGIGWSMYVSAYRALKGKSANMDTLIVMGTSAAYFYSVYLLFSGGMHTFFEASAVLITIVVFGRYLEAKAKGKTSEAIKKLIGLKPKKALVVRGKKEMLIDVDDVVVGDFIIVKPGEKVPVDGIIFSGMTSIDESMVTGESIPIDKKKGDKVIGATINKHGTFKFKASNVGENTTLAQIIRLIEDAQGNKAPIQRFADMIAGYFVPGVLVIALTTFLTWYFLGAEFQFAIITAVSVLVIACPCALGLATPTAIMVGTGKGAKKGILIKGGEALETTHKAKYIIFDKTGTITKGKPEVTDIISSDKEFLKIVGSLEKGSEHSLAEAIVSKAMSEKVKFSAVKKFKAIPGKGIQGAIGRTNYFFGNNKLMIDKKIKYDKFKNQKHELEKEGKTVMILSDSKKVIGLIAVMDVVKETTADAIDMLKKMDMKIYMITGDNKRTAEAISKKLKIDFFAEVMPKDKSDYVKKLQQKGKVIMVGDGINDAPALAQADVGIAMGSGTDVAMESGDIVLMKDNLVDVARAVKLSKMTMSKIKQNMFWALFYNTVGIPVAAGVFFNLTGWLLNPMLAGAAMALSSVSVVSNSLLLRLKKF